MFSVEKVKFKKGAKPLITGLSLRRFQRTKKLIWKYILKKTGWKMWKGGVGSFYKRYQRNDSKLDWLMNQKKKNPIFWELFPSATVQTNPERYFALESSEKEQQKWALLFV